jgi:hypothetical protein
MADTSLSKKLGLKPNFNLAVVNEPAGFIELLAPLPDGVLITNNLSGNFDSVIVFAGSIAELEQHALSAIEAIKPNGWLWFAYPKKSGKIKTDINRDFGWTVVNDAGWDGVIQISIDDTWSASRFKPKSEINYSPTSFCRPTN